MNINALVFVLGMEIKIIKPYFICFKEGAILFIFSFFVMFCLFVYFFVCLNPTSIFPWSLAVLYLAGSLTIPYLLHPE